MEYLQSGSTSSIRINLGSKPAEMMLNSKIQYSSQLITREGKQNNTIWRKQKDIPKIVLQYNDRLRSYCSTKKTFTTRYLYTINNKNGKLISFSKIATDLLKWVISDFQELDEFLDISKLIDLNDLNGFKIDISIKFITSANDNEFDDNFTQLLFKTWEEFNVELQHHKFLIPNDDDKENNNNHKSKFKLHQVKIEEMPFIPPETTIKVKTQPTKIITFEIETMYSWWKKDGEEVLKMFENFGSIRKLFTEEIDDVLKNPDYNDNESSNIIRTISGRRNPYVSVYVVIEFKKNMDDMPLKVYCPKGTPDPENDGKRTISKSFFRINVVSEI